MNPRIAKEIRTHSPALAIVAVCAAALMFVGMAQGPFEFINFQACLLGVYFIGNLVMAASTFGNEFQLRTISLLLSQPVDRRALWPEKMRVLALFNIASFIITFLALIAIPVTMSGMYPGDEAVIYGTMVLVPILFSCMTPYFTMVSRGTIGGIVFTLFVAGMLVPPSGIIWGWLAAAGFGPTKDRLTFGLLDGLGFVYVILSLPAAALFYWLGRRNFLRMEIIDSQALEASLPATLEAPLAKFSAQFSGAFSKLLFKELRLQRVSFLFTTALCLFMAVEYLAWKPDTQRTFFVAGILIIYVALFPVIVGASAVAEEKTWGMKDWHLTLPPSLKRQWRVKWLVALALTLLPGAGLACFLARIGPWNNELSLDFDVLQLCYPLLVAVALYAASISTSTIRAFLMTFGIIVAFMFTTTLLVAIFSLSFWTDGPVVPLGMVIGIMLGNLYVQSVWLLWNLIVSPVWWCTHSPELTSVVARWADPTSNHHLQIILLVIAICTMFWLILRFAKANYRHSDLMRRNILRQCVVLFLAIMLLGLVFVGTHNPFNFDSLDMPRWTLLPEKAMGR